MNWSTWYSDLCNMTETDARAYIEGLGDDTTLTFWSWNDTEACTAISYARAWQDTAYLARMAEDMRETLVRDVVAEIRFQKMVADADA